ncbi:MAG: hypothetical protein GY793_04705 [Proteobacteria bacterium]|nr:hypothetical protein [Pseudomonadota bacterium]
MKKILALIIAGSIIAIFLSGCSVTRTPIRNNVVEVPSCPVGNSEVVKELNAEENQALWNYFEKLYKYCLKIEIIKQELEND